MDENSIQEFLVAALRNDVATLQKSLQDGIDVNSVDTDSRSKYHGDSALHYAAQGQALEAIQFLLKEGADIDKEDRFGKTPLAEAVYYSKGKGKAILALLEAGADPDHKNNYGISPRDTANQIANYPVAQWLEAY